MNLCFDLDGPIIDVSDRYYRAYLESLKESKAQKLQPLKKEDFWALKQKRITDLEVGIMSGLTINESLNSAEFRRILTFKTEYLAQDKLFEDTQAAFEYLTSEKKFFFLVTLRRRSHLDKCIKQFKLNKYFGGERLFSIPDDQIVTNDIQEKYVLLVNALHKLGLDPAETWLIGDSDTDIHAARLARYGKVIAICRGIRSKEQLEILKPDYIVENLKEIVRLCTCP